MTRLRSVVQRRPLVAFFAIAIGLGCLLTALVARIPYDPLLLPLLALPISYAPALAAFLALRAGDDPTEWVAFWRRLRAWRAAPGWYLAALAIGPAIHLAGTGLATLAGGRVPFHPAALAIVLPFVPVNLGEEIGRRGYACRACRPASGLCRPASPSAGPPGCSTWSANLSQPPAYFVLGAAPLTAFAILQTWVLNRRGGGVLPTTLMHADMDTLQVAAPLTETGVTLTAYALVTAVAWVAAVVLLRAVGPDLGWATDGRRHVRAAFRWRRGVGATR